MTLDEIRQLVTKTIDFPVHYDPQQQTVWDSKRMMVCDIRGWGKIQFMKQPEERQDAIGELVARLLNEFSTKENLLRQVEQVPEPV